MEASRADAPTGVALILVDAAGENQIAVAPGANAELGPAQLDRVELGAADAVLCQLEIPDDAVIGAWHRTTGLFCLNAAPARPLEVDADLTVVNRYELETLARRDGLIAVTLGAEGAVLLEDGEEVARAAPPRVDAVDGTAAGDAFTACLLVSLLEGREREEALQRACAAGALAASRFGAQPSLPDHCGARRDTRHVNADRPRLRPGPRRRDRAPARAREPGGGAARRHHRARQPDARQDDRQRAARPRARRAERRPGGGRRGPPARARPRTSRRTCTARAGSTGPSCRQPVRGRSSSTPSTSCSST